MEGSQIEVKEERSRFWYGNGELRVIWKLAAFTSVAFAALIASGIALMLVEQLFDTIPLLTNPTAGSLSLLVATIVASAFCMRFIDRAPLSGIGLGFSRRHAWHFISGLAAAMAMITLFVLISAVAGMIEVRPSSVTILHAIETLGNGALLFVVVSLSEEILMRGYPFRSIVKASRPTLALAVTSLFFALIHYNNPSLDLLALGNIFLAGVWLGRGLVVSGSLWLPIGLHMGWNFAMGTLFGLPVSGVRTIGVFVSRTSGPDWITGGVFGPEGGILATCILLIGTGALSLPSIVRRLRVSDPQIGDLP